MFCESLSPFVGAAPPKRSRNSSVKRGAGLAEEVAVVVAPPSKRSRNSSVKRGAGLVEEVAVVVAPPSKRSRNSSDIAGKSDLFDSSPDDLVISILCKLSPSDFASVLLTCWRLKEIVPISLVQPHFRQKIVNKILETLKRHLPVSGQERLDVFGKMVKRFEENIYTSATSQSDYLRKISLRMLTMETKSQNPIGNALPSNSAGNSSKSPDAASLDSTAQTGHANGADWQEEVYQKIKTMKDLYLPEASEMYQKVAAKLQQHDSLPQQSKSDQLEKLKVFFERIITFLQVSKNNIPPGYKEKLGSYEKQIVNLIISQFYYIHKSA